ncbi:MAG: recombinase XerD, partial [Bacteroidota bacterium]|nr:recombinase XerD [Bacteroidota bacterium]
MNIIIYSPHLKSKRIKVFIPYTMEEERKLFKSIDGRFYHKQQNLWSVINTVDNLKLLKTIFKGKYEVVDQVKSVSIPKFVLSDKSLVAMALTEQKLILKAYSFNTIKTYKSELMYFFKYFENFDLTKVTKEQIESYVFYMITKYKIGESKQNTSI